MIRAALCLLAAGLVVGMGCSQIKSLRSGSGDIDAWKVAGIGTVRAVPEEKAFRVTEGKDSKGVTLISRNRMERML